MADGERPRGVQAPGPTVHVVGLGPAGPELVTAEASALLRGPGPARLRTGRHPAAVAFAGVPTFDERYEQASTFEEVYASIVDELVSLARSAGTVVYAVPGSPVVAERTVVLLGRHPEVAGGDVSLVVHPAVSFVDLACARLGVDPVAAGLHLVDATAFAAAAAGLTGPLLVAQCYARDVLSEVKLSAEPPPGTTVRVLHHLGLPDERVFEVAWDDLDRAVDPDHLTSLWVPELAAPVAAELVALDELVHVLRERCPWDRRQTHGSLARHLLEEAHEALEAIDELAALDELAARGGPATDQPATDQPATDQPATDQPAEAAAVAALEEELGDVLFQVFLHAALAAEAGRFELADVARGVHDKLVARHPHVFGPEAGQVTEPAALAADWEARKLAEKQRASVTDGVPRALPSLAVAAKLLRKAAAVGMDEPEAGALVERLAAAPRAVLGATDPAGALGELLFDAVALANAVGVDAETTLRDRARRFRGEVRRREGVVDPPGGEPAPGGADASGGAGPVG